MPIKQEFLDELAVNGVAEPVHPTYFQLEQYYAIQQSINIVMLKMNSYHVCNMRAEVILFQHKARLTTT